MGLYWEEIQQKRLFGMVEGEGMNSDRQGKDDHLTRPNGQKQAVGLAEVEGLALPSSNSSLCSLCVTLALESVSRNSHAFRIQGRNPTESGNSLFLFQKKALLLRCDSRLPLFPCVQTVKREAATDPFSSLFPILGLQFRNFSCSFRLFFPIFLLF